MSSDPTLKSLLEEEESESDDESEEVTILNVLVEELVSESDDVLYEKRGRRLYCEC